jgi:hypothetical protein
MSNNIFDTRNIIKETPKVGNRFLLTVNATTLASIVINSPLYKLLAKTSFNSLSTVFNGGGATNNAISDVLNLSLLSCTIPAFEFEAAELNHFNDTVKHLSKFTAVTDVSATYYDYINGSATSIMLAWQSMVGFKLTGEMGYKEDYVCDMDLFIYGPNRPGITPTGSGNADQPGEEALMQYRILNAWPRSVDVGEFSYDSAEIKKVTVQFGYDMVIPVMINSETLAGPGLNLRNFVDATENTTTSTSNVQSSGDDVLFGLKV